MEPSTSDINDKYLKLAADNIPAWNRYDDKNFEIALEIEGYSRDNIPKIARLIQKTEEEVRYYYEALFYDIELIESGLVKEVDYAEYKPSPVETSGILVNEKKRGRTWTEEEHRAFLEGMEKCEKGDWKNISRNYVRTRTPTQVASHAQKYLKRQAEQRDGTKKRRRSSIHDITL